MESLKFWLSIAQVVLSIALIIVILCQSSKSAGLSGAVSGASETFFGKQKGRSRDARLARATVWLSLIFAATTIALVVI